MKQATFDLVVLGAGPGGYVAAIRAAQLGLKTAIVDENRQLGGTCLRIGCIPSKALLESSHLYYESLNRLVDHGILPKSVTLDLELMQRRKEQIVSQLTAGVAMLLQRNKIQTYFGRGKLAAADTLEVSGDESISIRARHTIIATGSKPAELRGVPADGQLIGDSTAALSYSEPPGKLAVIGAGYIGLELGSVWSRLGSQVTVVEALDRVLPGTDNEIARIAQRTFEKQGLQFRLNCKVDQAVVQNGKCQLRLHDGSSFNSDRVLVCTGRRPNTEGCGLQTAGVQRDDRGFIIVDRQFRTSAPGVYAVGDCVPGPMLAHKASEEGVACVEAIVTGHGHVDYDSIPGIIYTHPEVASVGKTEEQLKDQSVEYRRGVCPYGANGRALTMGEGQGRFKILADKKTDRILGAHAIGARAGDLIAEVAVAIRFHASAEDLARTCHAHPTLSEIVHEAALAVDRRAIHT